MSECENNEQLGGNTEENTDPRLANLRPPWKPGESGNPNGRPKKKPITELYEKILNDTGNIALVEAAVIKAITGGRMAGILQLKEMAERVEGKVTQPIDAELTISSLAERMQKARDRADGESQ